jgi:malate/lactate dehydrogenase
MNRRNHPPGRTTEKGALCSLPPTGIEQVIEITLTAEESAASQKSAAAVRELVETLKL